MVISQVDTDEVVERWQFDIQCENTGKAVDGKGEKRFAPVPSLVYSRMRAILEKSWNSGVAGWVQVYSEGSPFLTTSWCCSCSSSTPQPNWLASCKLGFLAMSCSFTLFVSNGPEKPHSISVQLILIIILYICLCARVIIIVLNV